MQLPYTASMRPPEFTGGNQNPPGHRREIHAALQ